MAPLGFNARLQQRQQQQNHKSGSSNNNNSQDRSSSNNGGGSNGRTGGYHRGLNTLTRLGNNGAVRNGTGGAVNISKTIGAKNVPKPVNTSSLKKENGGQDVTAVLVNRNNVSGKKVGWGSALAEPKPTTEAAPSPTSSVNPSLPTPAESTKNHQPEHPLPATSHPHPKPQFSRPFNNHSQSSIPPIHAQSENTPWALHRPSPSQYHQEKGEGSLQDPNSNSNQPPRSYSQGYPPERFSQPPPDRFSQPPPDRFSQPPPDRFSQPPPERFSQPPPERFSQPPPERFSQPPPERFSQPPPERFSQAPFPPPSQSRHHNHNSSYPPSNDQYERPYNNRDHNTNQRWDGRGDHRNDHRPRDYRFNRGSPPPYDPRFDQRGRSDHRRFNDDDYQRGAPPPPSSSMPQMTNRRNEYHNHQNRYAEEDYDGRYNRNGPKGYHHHNGPPTNTRSEYREDPQNYYSTQVQQSGHRHDHNSNVHGDPNYTRGDPNPKGYPTEEQRIMPNDHTYHRTNHRPHAASNNTKGSQEEHVILQAIKEREDAEARTNQNVVHSVTTPFVILKNNNQTSGEASGHTNSSSRDNSEEPVVDMNHLSKIEEESVQVHLKDEVSGQAKSKEKESIKDETEPVKVEIEVQVEVEEKYTKPDCINAVIHVNEYDSHISEKVIKEQVESVKQSNHNDKPECIKQVYDKPESTVSVSKDVNVDVDTDIIPQEEMEGKTEINTQPQNLPKSPQKPLLNQTENKVDPTQRAIEQQQNVLRHVAASRKVGKNSTSKFSTKVEAKKRQVTPNEDNKPASTAVANTVVTPVAHVDTRREEREAAEALARAARAEERRTRGPRTKGVLFRRLPDDTCINADLSEEEIARREERKRAKLESIKAKLESIKVRQEQKEQRIKMKLERKAAAIQEEKDKEKERNLKSDLLFNKNKHVGNKTTEKALPSETTPSPRDKPKPFIPALPPAVSAWKSGPPPSFIKALSPQPKQDIISKIAKPILKSVPNNIIPNNTNAISSSDNGENNSFNTIPYSTDDLPKDSLVPQGDIPADVKDSVWDSQINTPQEHASAKKIGHMSPISLPVAGVTTWNTFGGTPLFSPPQQENGSAAVAADWGIRQAGSAGSDNLRKSMSWTDPAPVPLADPEDEEEEDVAGFTDASAVVRDLLSTTPGSEGDQEESKEEKIVKEIHRNKPNWNGPHAGKRDGFRRGPRNRTNKGNSNSNVKKKKYLPRTKKSHDDIPTQTTEREHTEGSDKIEIEDLNFPEQQTRAKRFSRKPRGGYKKVNTDKNDPSQSRSKSSHSNARSNKKPTSSSQNDEEPTRTNKRPKRPSSQRAKFSRKPVQRTETVSVPAGGTES